MKAFAKQGLRRLGLYERASAYWIELEPRLVRARRALTGRNQRLIDEYLATATEPKLQIGCGGNALAAWLNTELCPRGSEIYLDATEPFPFADATFALIYSEHMIEHVPAAGGRAMLAECFRVLKPGGRLRIVTPDLAFLLRLVETPASPRHQAYIRYSIETRGIDIDPASPDGTAVHVFNHFVRAWGHQFIYDANTLRQAMKAAGFEDITTCRFDDSSIPALCGLAKTDRMPPGFVELESLSMEGRKQIDR